MAITTSTEKDRFRSISGWWTGRSRPSTGRARTNPGC